MTLPLSEFARRAKGQEFEEEDWIPLHRVRFVQRRPVWNGVADSEVETEDTQSMGGAPLSPVLQQEEGEQRGRTDRERNDGEWQTMWDREKRIDLVFGSG